MAAQLSTTTTTTASAAFANPLPTVRQFHKQLHNALEEKNARLRTLVGGSYRQLLGTAETIVAMRTDMEVVEMRLGRVAERCGRNVVGKRVAGLGKLGAAGERDEAVLGWAARMKALSGCVVVVGRLLRGREGGEVGGAGGRQLVIAAKVLVLSRLLIKSLGDEIDSGDKSRELLLDEMKRKCGSLRKRLARAVRRTLVDIGGDRDDLIEALCASSLATSSGAKDVLRHFLSIRGEAMALEFQDEGGVVDKEKRQEGVMRALALYTKTLLDVQALVPRRLSEALLGLKGKPLLKDHAIRSLEGLRLDICEKWFGDEILFFTPYIRHDDLDGAQTTTTLKGWAKKASEVLIQGFETTLSGVVEFKTVVELRTKIFETWVSEGGKAKGFDPSIMLDGFREVVNARMVDLLEARVSKLHLVGTQVEASLASWTASNSHKETGPWGDELLEMELSRGAGLFKQAIISHVHGRTNAISRVIKGYETWRHLIDEMVANIELVKKQRWDDDLDSLEDDFSLETRNTLLSSDDPGMLLDRLDINLKQAFQKLDEKHSTLFDTYKDSEDAGSITYFILRVLRDLRNDLPTRPDLSSFGLSLVPRLHNTLAHSVSSTAISAYTEVISSSKRVAGRALWEGTPELPIYPSPATFKFLHSMTSAMANAGSDLWSPAAVSVLKQYLGEQLGQDLLNASVPSQSESAKANGGDADTEGAVTAAEPVVDDETTATIEEEAEAEAEADVAVPKSDDLVATKPEAEKSLDVPIQLLYDIFLLKRCLALSPGASNVSLGALEESVIERSELDAEAVKRLEQAAAEYWKRTNLLFGLLA